MTTFKYNIYHISGEYHMFGRQHKPGSESAPLT